MCLDFWQAQVAEHHSIHHPPQSLHQGSSHYPKFYSLFMSVTMLVSSVVNINISWLLEEKKKKNLLEKPDNLGFNQIQSLLHSDARGNNFTHD